MCGLFLSWNVLLASVGVSVACLTDRPCVVQFAVPVPAGCLLTCVQTQEAPNMSCFRPFGGPPARKRLLDVFSEVHLTSQHHRRMMRRATSGARFFLHIFRFTPNQKRSPPVLSAPKNTLPGRRVYCLLLFSGARPLKRELTLFSLLSPNTGLRRPPTLKLTIHFPFRRRNIPGHPVYGGGAVHGRRPPRAPSGLPNR